MLLQKHTFGIAAGYTTGWFIFLKFEYMIDLVLTKIPWNRPIYCTNLGRWPGQGWESQPLNPRINIGGQISTYRTSQGTYCHGTG